MNRRHFNKVMGVSCLLNGWALKGFGNIKTLENSDHVLVLINLNGGNDGLNTVIPADQYANYQAARKNIAIPEEKLLPLDFDRKTALHPAMAAMHQMFKDGKVRVIQNVGYANPNFSHFRATDIWNTASDANQVLASGWAGRYFSLFNPNYPNGYPNDDQPDPLAIQIGSAVSTVLQGPVASMGLAISNTNSFYNLLENTFDQDVPPTNAGKELAFLRKMATQTNQYSSRIKAAAAKVTSQGAYPANNALADQLKIVSRLIAGGLKTQMYVVNLGGFDTHSAQAVATDTTTGTHATLLQRLSEATAAFMADLKTQGVHKKVLGMTYSEFGRRIKSNDSGGTDHGAAAPVFIFGEMVNGGLSGTNPKLKATTASGDNLPMEIDFRNLYATILQDWFCLPTADISQVLVKNFSSMGLVQPQACGITLSAQEPRHQNLKISPNPVSSIGRINWQSSGSQTIIQIFDMLGHEIETVVDSVLPKGDHTFDIDVSHWPNGMYLCQARDAITAETIKFLKD